MDILDSSLKPGHEALKACPSCGEDKVYRTNGWELGSIKQSLLTPEQYFCEACGYEADRSEVEKSLSQLWTESKPAFEKLQSIGDPNLIERVEDKKVEGWKIKEVDTMDEKVIMWKTEGGSIGGHAVAGLLSLGIGNILYGDISRAKNEERIVLRSQQNPTDGFKTQVYGTNEVEKLQKLKELYDEGVISEEDFNKKKEELLDDL